MRRTAVSLGAAGLLVAGLSTSANADTFGSIHCDTVTSAHNRQLKVCAQVNQTGGRTRAEVSVHWLNGANPRQEYASASTWIKGGVVWLYRDGTPLSPQSSLECGHDGYPGCTAPTNGYSLWDPDTGTHTYQAQITADQILWDGGVTGFWSTWSNPVNI